MSVISSNHQIVPFISGESKALHGQRLAKVGYKSSAKTPAKFKSVCVSVPPVTQEIIEPMIPMLMSHIIELVQNGQDGIIKSLYESSNGKLVQVSDSDISITAVINFLEAENAGNRLTKELIAGWFDTVLSDNVTVLIAEKLNFTGDELSEEQSNIVSKHLNGYREVFSSLAGGKTFLAMKQINGLKVVLDSVDFDTNGGDDIAMKIIKRLNVMENEHNKVNELASLL